MKAIHFFIALSVLFLLSCTSTKSLKETDEKVTRMVNDRNYEIRMSYANPVRLSQVALSSGYTLSIKGDSAFAYLPYYGVAYVAPMNPAEGGIKFAEPMQAYKLSENKKKDGWMIDFKVNTTECHYRFHLLIFSNGNSDVQIISSEKESINFTGELVL
jgi:hypothetical protein